MEENNDGNSSSFKLLQPELMTVEQLCEILQACCVKNTLSSCTKNELVELFKRVALPLPQREYVGNSWRQKVLLKNQKRKSPPSVERTDVKRLCTTNGSTRKLCLVEPKSDIQSIKISPSSSIPCRLKPPVDLNNYTKKVLKLALPDSKSHDTAGSRKIVINEKKELQSSNHFNKKTIKKEEPRVASEASKSGNLEQPVSNGKHKRIVIDFSGNSTSTKTPKVVNLKRATSTNEY